jgi:hypothetical protein
MQMIDVMKRLAQLDATTPAIDTGAAVLKPVQSVTISENGPMGMMGMGGMSQPHTPASINMTAATGDELSGMLKDIMSLAGINKSDDSGMDSVGEPMMALTAEPEIGPDAGAGPGATDGEVMRSVLDKLNPDDGEKADGEENPFGGDDQGGDDVSQSHGDFDNDGDHDMDDHDAEKDSEEDDKEKAEETYGGPQYSTTPNDPNKLNPYPKNSVGTPGTQDAAGEAGSGNTMFGKKRTEMQPSAFESLMKEYKSFIGESEEVEEDDMEEGIEDRLKDLDPKNPVNIPAYQRKAASGDSASAAKNTKESANESMADILKLSGLK